MNIFPINNKILDYFFIMYRNKKYSQCEQHNIRPLSAFLHFDILHFVNDNFSVSYTFVNFKLTFIDPKRQDMS